MALRKFLLRVVLWSLIVAAVVGAVAVLVSAEDVVWRILGTALATASAAGLAVPLLLMTEKPSLRFSGFVGLSSVVLIFFCTLVLIWEPQLGWRHIERYGLTIVLAAALVLPSMLVAWMRTTQAARIAGWFGLALFAGVFLAWMVLIWTDTFWTWTTASDKAVACVWAGTFCGLASLICLVGQGTDRRYWRWVGIVAAVLAAAMAMYAIVRDIHSDSGAFTVVCSLALVVMHANILELCPLPGRQRWLGRAAILAAVATAVMVDVLVIRKWEDSAGRLARAASATAILATCGSLAALILAAINRRIERPPVVFEDVTSYTILCPLCGTRQQLPVGKAQCAKCRLVINAQFEVPRCAGCGYALLMLTSARCPECGLEVAGGDKAQE